LKNRRDEKKKSRAVVARFSSNWETKKKLENFSEFFPKRHFLDDFERLDAISSIEFILARSICRLAFEVAPRVEGKVSLRKRFWRKIPENSQSDRIRKLGDLEDSIVMPLRLGNSSFKRSSGHFRL
jgi:hypothetical protein